MKHLAFTLLLILVSGCASGPQIHADYIEAENVAIFQTDAVAGDWGALRASSVVPLDTLAPTVQLTLYVDHAAASIGCSTWRLAMNDATDAGEVLPSVVNVEGKPVITLLIDLETLAALEVGQAVGFEICGRTFNASESQLKALAEFAARILAALDALRGTK